jgi:multidrug efflux pump subunit AcrB
MAEFFIRRPIVAIVIAVLIVLLGVSSLTRLSFEQYPFLAPPIIRITALYPGASATAVEQSVATPIEQEVNGVDKMIYMQSSNTSDGRMLLDVNFAVGINQDTANVLTQNRVASAQARLPQEVTAQGVTIKKQSPSILLVVSVYSPGATYDGNYLINYAGINLRDQLLRIPGVAQVDLVGGTDYSMRVWLRPDTLAKLGLTPGDVMAAIKEQNLQAPSGRIGVAKADYFPRLFLIGSMSAGGLVLNGQTFGPQGLFSVLPSVTVPIFTAGRVSAGVRAARARADAAALQYQQTILAALHDVSDALVEYGKRREARAEQEALTVAARETTRLANVRYRGGVSPYLEVLDSERQLFDAELGLVRLQRDELLAVVRLYKALGGGWQTAS